MDIVKFPIGADADVALSVSLGKIVLMVEVSAKPEIDALLAKLKAALPVIAQPLVDMAQAAIDAELDKA